MLSDLRLFIPDWLKSSSLAHSRKAANLQINFRFLSKRSSPFNHGNVFSNQPIACLNNRLLTAHTLILNWLPCRLFLLFTPPFFLSLNIIKRFLFLSLSLSLSLLRALLCVPFLGGRTVCLFLLFCDPWPSVAWLDVVNRSTNHQSHADWFRLKREQIYLKNSQPKNEHPITMLDIQTELSWIFTYRCAKSSRCSTN